MTDNQNPILTLERERKYNTVFQAIARADEPPTRNEITLETNLSDRQVYCVLRDLRDRGRVRSHRDDEDGRLIRYEIDAGGIDR